MQVALDKLKERSDGEYQNDMFYYYNQACISYFGGQYGDASKNWEKAKKLSAENSKKVEEKYADVPKREPTSDMEGWVNEGDIDYILERKLKGKKR